MIKLLLPRICLIITHIVNASFETGIFPDRWKKAIIKPIPKIDIPMSPSDFRPISLLPVLSKIIEKLVNIQRVYNSYWVHNAFYARNYLNNSFQIFTIFPNSKKSGSREIRK